MTPQLTAIDKLLLAFVVGVSLVALWISLLSPGFILDNDLVYGGF